MNTGEKYPDVCLVEIQGIGSTMYLEALQRFQFRVGRENFLVVHLGFLPVIDVTGELKTKPCQHPVKLFRETGLKSDLLICRSVQKLDDRARKKHSLFCQVPLECALNNGLRRDRVAVQASRGTRSHEVLPVWRSLAQDMGVPVSKMEETVEAQFHGGG